MKRRTFLKTLSVGLAGSYCFKPEDIFSMTAGEPPVMSIIKGSNPSVITTEAIKAIGGMSSFVSKGESVLVKPNMGWDRLPEHAANTNPEVVGTLVKLAFEAGAKKVKVFDYTCNSARRCYQRSGIKDAAEAAGADVSFINDKKFITVNMKGVKLKEWPVYKDAIEVDKIINVPVAKHHTLADYTLSMKNLMGIIGGRRNLLHQRLDLNIPDMAAFFRPTLTVLDAVRILTANGPQGGNLNDVKTMNTVAASTDQVAIDSFGTTLFGKTGQSLPYIVEAHKRGLGEIDLSKVQLIERTV
jgi:uncharacterized protein (DUF362 family)